MENIYSASQADLSVAPDERDTYLPDVWTFSGRIGRLRYIAYSTINMLLWYLVFAVFGYILVRMIGASLFTSTAGTTGLSKLTIAIVILFYMPVIGVLITYARRRLHDLGLSGWLSILIVIPLINFFFWLYLIFAPGTQDTNRFGQAPCKNSTWVVIGASLLPLFFVIGILAAIALPAYQKYVQKAKAVQVEQVIPAEQNP